MVKRIDKDQNRFRQIIRGKVKKDLRKYITRGELIGKKGKDFVSIPLPQIRIPHFRYGTKKAGGVGQGEGAIGTPLGRGELQPGPGAGDAPGEHILEVDITLDELAQMLGEELELPNVEPKGKKNITDNKDKYTGISQTGPDSLKHFKRTYKQALKRQLIMQTYNPDNPVIIPIREDRRYRSWKVTQEPESNAVIIYMMDVSGSMGEEQKEIVRIEAFWIDTWLRYQYKNIETRYIIHDAVARIVDKDTFYHTRESGGTIISSAYKLANRLIGESYSPSEWNIYLFHFSDGDNWGEIDTDECIAILETHLIPKSNLFCYGQVESPYGSGQFIQDLEDYFHEEDKIVFSEILDKEGIYDSIKQFLGKGK
ncbi:MAG: DUF444 family protein [bacterium]